MPRKRSLETSSSSSRKSGMHTGEKRATTSFSDEAATGALSDGQRSSEIEYVAPAVLASCRSALERSPAASRAALIKHRASIDPALARTLEAVGGYTVEKDHNPLRESMRRGDVATAQSLIAVGVYADSQMKYRISTVLICTKYGSAYHAFLQHHATILKFVNEFPDSLVSNAVAHCATLSGCVDAAPAPALSLHTYQLEPSFLWAPGDARAAIFAWAKDAYVVHIAATTEPFTDLPDDCAGDVLDYLDLKICRMASLLIVTKLSSPDARAWVRAVTAAAVAVNATKMLYAAVRRGDADLVQDIIKKGADVDAESKDGEYALIEAARHGCTAIVKLLLEAGAAKEIINRNGDSALMEAAQYGHPAVVKLLLEGGPYSAKEGYENAKAIMFAAGNGHIDIIKLLLEAGIEKDTARFFTSDTALMAASEYGHISIVKLLLDLDADVNLVGDVGNTALIDASSEGHTDIVKLLLDAGANKEIKDKSGKTALDYANERGRAQVVRLLERK